MSTTTTTKPVLMIGKENFPLLVELYSCNYIIEGKSIPGTFHYRSKEYVITGYMQTGKDGIKCFFANQVVDLALYQRPFKPLNYADHCLEMNAGNRARSYAGLLIKYGKRKLVCLDDVHFEASHEVEQLSLF
jgi:hypothetical protein